MVSTGLRALGTTAALVAIYYLLPLDHTSTWVAATILVIGLVAFIAMVIFQVRSIIRSRFPGLRAVEALATSLPLFLLLFSGTYVVMAAVSATNFGEKLRVLPGPYGPGKTRACQNERVAAVVHGHLRGALVPAELEERWSWDERKRSSKQRVAGSSPAGRAQTYFNCANARCSGGRGAVVKHLGATDIACLLGSLCSSPRPEGVRPRNSSTTCSRRR